MANPYIINPRHVVDWMGQNTDEGTGFPGSFWIPPDQHERVYRLTSDKLEWTALRLGANMYDVANAMMFWTQQELYHRVDVIVRALDRGYIGAAPTLELKAYFNPSHISAHPYAYGPHAGRQHDYWFFRMTNKDGHYHLNQVYADEAHFPNGWCDWYPFAGENAWLVLALIYYYQKSDDSKALDIARHIALGALYLQDPMTGGVRMAPRGTHHTKEEGLDPEQRTIWYNTISTENNISWWAAFEQLFRITQEMKYEDAREDISDYLRNVFDRKKNMFATGMVHADGKWTHNTRFATDCQTWAICVLGPDLIDEWFESPGMAIDIWRKTKTEAGFYQDESLHGVDFTNWRALGRQPMISYEWTAGAILATRLLRVYYQSNESTYASEVEIDEDQMRRYCLSRMLHVDDQHLAWPYASGKGRSACRATGFGWYAPTEEVLSLASTIWMMHVHNPQKMFHPFALGFLHDQVDSDGNPFFRFFKWFDR